MPTHRKKLAGPRRRGSPGWSGLAELARAIPKGTHAAIIMDRAGWHVVGHLEVPGNITLVPLPPYSPELDAIEQLWRYRKDTDLSDRVLSDLAVVIDAGCEAWNVVIAETDRVRSVWSETWARVRN